MQPSLTNGRMFGSGKDNPNFNGYRTKHKKGYVQVAVGRRPSGHMDYKMEHRLIMEKHLGRKLEPHESVHHINGIKDDNRIENLELWDRSQPTGQRVEDKIAWCKEFLRKHGETV